MKLCTESWLDLTLSDPLRHRGSLQHSVAGTDLVKYQTRIARLLCLKLLNTSKISATYPRLPDLP